MAKKKDNADRRVVTARIKAKKIYLITADVLLKPGEAIIEDLTIEVSGQVYPLAGFVANFGPGKAKAAIEGAVRDGLGGDADGRKVSICLL